MADPLAKPIAKPAADPGPEQPTAKLFMHGRSQAVRLPKAFRLPGSEVRVRRLGNGVLLEPIEPDLRAELDAWFARIDAIGGPDFPMPEEPPMPPDPPPIFDDDELYEEGGEERGEGRGPARTAGRD